MRKKIIEFMYKFNKAFVMILKGTNLIDIMNKLVHLFEPCMCILVLEICSHGPHNMICASNVSLKNSKEVLSISHNRFEFFLVQNYWQQWHKGKEYKILHNVFLLQIQISTHSHTPTIWYVNLGCIEENLLQIKKKLENV